MRFILLILSFITTIPLAHAANDDLILQTRVDSPSLDFLIDKTRVIMSNDGMSDGLSGTTTFADINITMKDLLNDASYLALAGSIGKDFHMDVKNAILRVRIPSLTYKVKTVHVDPHQLSVQDPALDLTTTAQIQGIEIGLPQGLQLDFMMTNPATKQVESYFTAYVEASTITLPDSLPPIQFNLAIEAIRDQKFTFKLKSYDLSSLPGYVTTHLHDILEVANSTQKPITADQIKVNPVVMKLDARLTRSYSFDTFKPLVQKEIPTIINDVFLSIGKSLQTTLGPSILKSVFSSSIKSDLSIAYDSLYARFSSALFFQPNSQQLALGISGDLCTGALYKQFTEACVDHESAFVPPRILSAEDQQKGKDDVSVKLASGQADVALSVSEDYLNRLIKTTLETGMWDALKKHNISIGPKGAFLIFDEVGQNPQIYLDLIFSGDSTWPEKWVINAKHPIRFPLRMTTGIDFKVVDKIPHVYLSTGKLISDVDEIVNGISQYDMPSHLVPLIRKDIAKTIIKMITDTKDGFENYQFEDMDLPIFKDIGLETTSHETSQYGRLNLYFKM
jgi:hypothetical protein